MKGGGWHGWLWRLRFAELQAEMAAARADYEEAMELARDALEQSRSKHRAKYEVFARMTLAQAMAARGRKKDALGELHAAVRTAEKLGNPSLQVMVAAALLALEPDGGVAQGARGVVSRVLANLSDPTLRDRFLRSDAVRTVRSA